MTKEEIKNAIRSNVQIIQDESRDSKGGQHCGLIVHPFIVKSEEVEFELKVRYYKSDIDNKNLAMRLFDVYLDEIIK